MKHCNKNGEYNIKYFFSDDVFNTVKEEIREHNGGEIFFACLVDDSSIVEVEPICYGNNDEVLALHPSNFSKNFNAVLHNHPSGDTKPSYADLNYASFLQNEGIGFFITNNDATKITTVTPPVKTAKQQKLDSSVLEEIFSKDGAVEKELSKNGKYQFRAGQLKMVKAVANSLNSNSIALIEAGTGIGKSLSYLIPAFLWAINNDERIVISTNTINLQSQLIEKDIPLVKKILKSDIEAIVIKGRRNYLCKLKLNGLQNELDFNEDPDEIKTILEWANSTHNGVVDELNFIPQNNVWEKVCSEADFCSGSHCYFYKECFLQHSRRLASQSNIIVANHHILFADISLRQNSMGLDENILLPAYKKIIIDEAHNIEKSASSYFSYEFSKIGFYKFISYYRMKNNKSFFQKLSQKLAKSSNKQLNDIALFITTELFGAITTLYENSFNIFDIIGDYTGNFVTETYKNNNYYRVKKDQWESEIFKENVISPLNGFLSLLDGTLKSLNKLSSLIEILEEKIKNMFEIDFKMVQSYKTKFENYIGNVVNLLNIDIEKYVVWFNLSIDSDNLNFVLTAAPLKIDRILAETLFSVFDSIVLSSATLTVDRKFDFFNRLSGISLVNNKKVDYLVVDSPFNYEKQVLVVVPNDIPVPTQYYSDDNIYNKKLNNFLKESIEETKGGSIVLFTAYNQLKKSYEDVEPYLKKLGYNSFCQGDMERTKLLNRFKEEIDSNLFATDSFWEGIDAPGETLRYVALVKLPFKIPSEPMEEARVEDYEKMGLNPFLEWTLPQAIIKFRQGFGRLIRSETDYGVVAILDSRVITKSYGKIFIRSLPRCDYATGDTEHIISMIKKHIENFK